VIGTVAPGLTAAGCASDGLIVKVAVAEAPVAPVTVTVCVPAAKPEAPATGAGITKPESSTIMPLVLTVVRPVGVVAVRVVGELCNVTVSVSPALYPEPLNAIVNGTNAEPGVLEVGETAIEAAAMLKVEAAVLTGTPPVVSDNEIVCVPGR